jgi:hypothetical protein
MSNVNYKLTQSTNQHIKGIALTWDDLWTTTNLLQKDIFQILIKRPHIVVKKKWSTTTIDDLKKLLEGTLTQIITHPSTNTIKCPAVSSMISFTSPYESIYNTQTPWMKAPINKKIKLQTFQN